MTRQEIKHDLKKLLKKSRYEHTLGVEYTACCLAMRYGADMEKAGLAGLLHDCAKYLSPQELLTYGKLYGLSISPYEKASPELLHAPVGACIAREHYGIEDEEILSAIRWHTTGRPHMSLLEKILFVADYMEPNRYKQEDLDQVRSLAFVDLDQCLRVILTDTVAYLKTRSFVTDPMTEKTWDYYCKTVKNKV
ncbi:MAG: bis(5'-nucleosyl)-tetraphosphatase (symmetrical) YqeK [Eubacterium sp.]|nr:bis(5'-nucleosyl)-tetraphosphatase (symmetrical) YqeK [Eubacterium sp.]